MTYEELLEQAARADERIVVMTAENRAAIRNLPSRLGPRFIDVGIAEQTLIGSATGLALRGRVPVAHALSAFLTMRAFEFIRTDVGISGLPVKMVGAFPGFLSDGNGPTHQAIEDVALMRGIPPVNVFCPSDEAELVEGMASIIADGSPWYVRYNARKPSFTHRTPFASGVAEVLAEGRDVAILSYGCLVHEVVDAAERLSRSGVSARVINMRTLKPIDEAAILAAARELPLIVTVEDHFQTGGLATIVAEVAAAHDVHVHLHPIALANRWFTPALYADVLRTEGFTGEQLAARISAFTPLRPSRASARQAPQVI